MIISVDAEGSMEFIWSDELACLRDLGECDIRRASHVEPTVDALWEADMSPSGGPVLGKFATRGEAIAAELEWLAQHKGL